MQSGDEIGEGTSSTQGSDDGLLGRIADLKRLGIDSILQGEILIRLRHRKATAYDLALEIFCHDEDDPPTHAQYMRCMRALGTLGRRGYVAKALFGKEKPYRLTKHGEECLMALVTDRQRTQLITNLDIILHAASALLVATSYSLTLMGVSSSILIASWFLTGIFSGLALSRFVRTARRIS